MSHDLRKPSSQSISCAYNQQLADIFIKALGVALFGHLLGKLGIFNIHFNLIESDNKEIHNRQNPYAHYDDLYNLKKHSQITFTFLLHQKNTLWFLFFILKNQKSPLLLDTMIFWKALIRWWLQSFLWCWFGYTSIWKIIWGQVSTWKSRTTWIMPPFYFNK